MSNRLVLSLVLAVAGPAAALGAPHLYIHGPKGCSFFDGLGGDGAAFHALDDDHLILDYGMLEGTRISCQFDGQFSLESAPGKTETLSGRCAIPDADEREATFVLTYTDGDNATLTSDMFAEPVAFLACAMP